MFKTIEITPEALEQATPEQLDRVAVLLGAETAEKITVATGATLSLPGGYLSFAVSYSHGQPMYGGIDAEGRAST